MLASLAISTMRWDLLKAPRFIGLDNYQRLFNDDPLFWQSLRVTIKYTLALRADRVDRRAGSGPAHEPAGARHHRLSHHLLSALCALGRGLCGGLDVAAASGSRPGQRLSGHLRHSGTTLADRSKHSALCAVDDEHLGTGADGHHLSGRSQGCAQGTLRSGGHRWRQAPGAPFAM